MLTLRAVPLFLLLLSACSGGGGGSSPAASATIAPAGGMFEITDGKLARVKVEIPAGAITAPVLITAKEAFQQAHPGFKAIGRAVTLAPDTPFRLPVRVSLPVEPSRLSSNETVLLQRTATGDILEGHRSTSLPHLANISYRLDRSLKFVGAQEKFANDPAADAMLTRVYRKPYVVPETV